MFIIQYLQKILSYYTITMYNKKKIFLVRDVFSI